MSRGSQVQTPQTGRPHSGPVTSTAVVNTTPTSAEDEARSSHFRLPVARKAMPTNTTKNARNPIHALGTWI